MGKQAEGKSKKAPQHAREGEEPPIEDIDEEREVIPYRYSITSYGADYPVEGLVKRIEAGDILVPSFDPEFDNGDSLEGFQRKFIWSKLQCDRFIESLLIGLPVPGIFLVRQTNGRFLVLDGQQRLRTLQAFYKGMLRGQEFRLENVQSVYKDLNYDDLDVEDRRRLDNGIIHATIVRQDEPSDDQSSIYLIFERLNTGGTTLHPQEIRVALYPGDFAKLLRELNALPAWRNLYGGPSPRLKDQELILRFFALLKSRDRYERPMKDFLNRFMGENRELSVKLANEFKSVFTVTCELILKSLGKKAFRLKTALNAAVLDSVMVGVAARLHTGGNVRDQALLKSAYDALLRSADFLRYVERATADEESVRKRIEIAIAAFSRIR